MDFNEYQEKSRRTYAYIPIDYSTLTYPTLGLLNEAGEFAGKLKKIYRDKGGVLSDADKLALVSELGDILWYWMQIVTNLGFTFEEVAQMNIDKLADRQARGVIGGEGDNR